jgi:hypothetical protein
VAELNISSDPRGHHRGLGQPGKQASTATTGTPVRQGNVSRPAVYRVLDRHQARLSAGGPAENDGLAEGLPVDTQFWLILWAGPGQER